MLPRERVFAALEHREPDRVPWGEHFIDYNVFEDVLGRPTWVHSKFRETQALWDGRRDEVVESYRRDIIDITRAIELDICTVNWVHEKGYAPVPWEKIDEETYRDEKGNLYRISIATHNLMPFERNTANYVAPTMESLEEEIDRMEREPVGGPEQSGWELVHHAVKEMKKTHFIMLLCGDVSWPTFGATEEEGWMNLLLEPEIAKKIAERDAKRLMRQFPVFAQLGVDGIMPCGDLGTSTGLMASPQIYCDMLYPWHKKYVEKAHRLGLKVLKHCCGHTWPIIERLAEVYDAYEAIQASAGMDIRKLKERVGAELCLWGGIWHEHIISGTVEDIRRDAAYAFRYAAPGGGYIMGSSHSLAVGAKPENVMEMKRCRDEWGVYPINPKKFKA